MKTYKNFKELNNADPLIYSEIFDISDIVDFEEPFTFSLGGDIIVIESLNELENVVTYTDEGFRMVSSNVTKDLGLYDVLEYLGPNKEFLMLVYITNNSGGITWFIPKEIYQQCNTITSSKEIKKCKLPELPSLPELNVL
jgi:hypothetical protein